MTAFCEVMKLEAIDPLNLSSICVATVMEVLKFGYMMIRIDSYAATTTGSDWFCYHEKSPCIFPVGFCKAHGIPLTPPHGYSTSTFNWNTYLAETKSIPAMDQVFHRFSSNHGFKVRSLSNHNSQPYINKFFSVGWHENRVCRFDGSSIGVCRHSVSCRWSSP